jgi:hypothetical protein
MEVSMSRGRHLRKRQKLNKAYKYIFFGVLFMVIFLTYGLWPRDGHGGIRQDSASPSDIYEDHEINCYTITPTIVQIAQPTPSVKSIEPTPEVEPRYGFTEDEIYLLAQLLCGDENISGDGEYDIDFVDPSNINYYEVSKVLCVVMNRVRSKDFPNTVADVVLQKGQFSVMPQNANKEPSDIALQTVREWCEAYDNHSNFIQVVPTNHLFFTGNGVANITRAKYK